MISVKTQKADNKLIYMNLLYIFVRKNEQMIQRVQTLYLILAALATGLLFFFPLAEIAMNNNIIYQVKPAGLFEPAETGEILAASSLPALIITGLCILLSLIAMFIYKQRKLQVKICLINIVFLILSLVAIYYYVTFQFSKSDSIVHYKIFVAMPVVSAILIFLAIKAIKKDEELVRSIDRIR